MQNSSRTPTFLLGALFGAGAGLVVGFLTSPHRGATTRNLIANQMRHYVAEARKGARRAEARGRDLRNRAAGLAHDLRVATLGPLARPTASTP